MYFVKYGDKYLHDPRVGDALLIDLSLTAEENSFGYIDYLSEWTDTNSQILDFGKNLTDYHLITRGLILG